MNHGRPIAFALAAASLATIVYSARGCGGGCLDANDCDSCACVPPTVGSGGNAGSGSAGHAGAAGVGGIGAGGAAPDSGRD